MGQGFAVGEDGRDRVGPGRPDGKASARGEGTAAIPRAVSRATTTYAHLRELPACSYNRYANCPYFDQKRTVWLVSSIEAPVRQGGRVGDDVPCLPSAMREAIDAHHQGMRVPRPAGRGRHIERAQICPKDESVRVTALALPESGRRNRPSWVESGRHRPAQSAQISRH
jgi:hypothetical protein